MNNNKILIIFSFLFGIVYSAADQLYKNDQLAFSLIQCIVAGLLYGIIISIIHASISSIKISYIIISPQNLVKKYWIFLGTLIVIYSICLFTYFPGVGMNDSLNIMKYGMEIINQFPAFYCAFITILTKIGRYLGTLQISIALYSVIQMIVVCSICAGIITWFWSKPIFKPLKYGILIFYTLEPLMPMYAISMIKDTLFSLFLTVLMIFTYEIVHRTVKTDQRNRFWICFDILLLGIVAMRNNGSYIIIPFLAALCVILKEYRKKIFFAILITVIGIFLSILPLKLKNREPLFQEAVGIPLQQIAAVVVNEGKITTEQEHFIAQLMPLAEIKNRYNPASVDHIKWADGIFDRQFLNEHNTEFLTIWLEMLPQNFSIYVKAYLQQTFGFWAPLQTHDVQCFFSIETFAGNAHLPDFVEENGIHDQTLFPEHIHQPLRCYYQTAIKFFNEGVLFWIMGSSALLVFLKHKDIKNLLPYFPGLLCWLTLMISTPVSSSLRYVLMFVYSLPCYIVFPFLDNME